MKKLRLALAVLALAAFVAVGRAGDRLPGYIQAESRQARYDVVFNAGYSAMVS